MKRKTSIVKNYEFETLGEGSDTNDYLETSFEFGCEADEKIIKSESGHAESNNFDIHPIIKEKRGILAYEEALKEEAIEEEVQKRLEEVRDAAFEKGYQEGKSKGKSDVYEQTKIEASDKLDRLGEAIDEVLKSKIRLIREEKEQIYDVIQTLAKWVVLRELNDDGNYLRRLLDSLSKEIETGSKIVVYMDQENFKSMPEFVDYAKEKFKDCKNVKVEIGHDMEGPGIVLCSESEIVSGLLKDQLESLESLFESYEAKGDGG